MQTKSQQIKSETASKPVDTRTPEEIDASYRRNLARFEEAKAKFERSFALKV